MPSTYQKSYDAYRKAGYSPSQARALALKSEQSSMSVAPQSSTGKSVISSSGGGASSSGGGATTTGGMSTPSGPVLVTPSGQVVGSALTPSPNQSQQRSGLSSQQVAMIREQQQQTEARPLPTTTTERLARQSLPPEVRELTPTQVREIQRQAQSRQPTQTEQALGQSLPQELRNLPPEEVQARMSFQSGQTTPPPPTIAEQVTGTRINEMVDGSEMMSREQVDTRKILGIYEAPEKITNFLLGTREQGEKDIQLREAERQATYGELIGRGQLPSLVRKGFREGGELFVTIGEKITGKPLPSPLKVSVGEFIGESFLFTALGTSPTRVDIVKKIQPTGVVFLGQQGIIGGQVQTDVVFLTTKGQKGVGRGISEVILEKGGTEVVKTQTQVVAFKRGVQFPTAKTIIQPTEEFAGVELSFVKRATKIGENQASISLNVGKMGKVQDRDSLLFRGIKKTEDFIGAGLSVEGEQASVVVSREFTRKGESYGLGIIRKPTEDDTIKIFTKGFKDIQQTASKQVQTSIQSIVNKAPTNNIQTKPFVSSIKKVKESITIQEPKQTSAYYGLGLYERTEGELMPQSVKPFQSSMLKQRINLSVSQPSLQSMKTKQNQITSLSLSQEVGQGSSLRFIQKEIQTTKQRSSQIQQLRLKQQTKQQQRFRTPSIHFFPRVRHKETIPFHLFLKGKYPSSKGGSILVSLKRYGKFKSIGFAKSISQAISIGRGKAERTLGATFKITGARQNIPTPLGFYPKYSKKEGLLFIEKTQRRINTPSEKLELKIARRKI